MILHSIDKSLQILIYCVYRIQYNKLFVLKLYETLTNKKGGKNDFKNFRKE